LFLYYNLRYSTVSFDERNEYDEKQHVTKITWNCDDSLVATSLNSSYGSPSIKVWNSCDAQLVHELNVRKNNQ
jgi:hypothetical protein